MQPNSTVRLAGRVLGKCILRRRIGKGGMARVFLAEHTLLKRQVAVKVLSGELTRDPGEIRRFLDEAVSVARLNHPHIIGVHDVGQEEDRPYIVMEYAGGGDLHERVRRDGPFAVARAVRIARDVADALDHAHRMGVIHQDLKPGNLLLTDDGRVKIADFGLARLDAAGPEAVGWGTPQILAPEVLLGGASSPRSDLYSLGVVLYFLLVGEYPFEGRSWATVARRQRENPRPSPADRRPDVPPALSHLLLRLLSLEPEGRPSTAAELVVELDRLSGSPREEALTGAESVADLEQLLRAGTWGEALRQARARARERFRRERFEDAAAALATCAHIGCLIDDPRRAERHARGAGKLAVRCGSPLVLGWSLAATALAHLRSGDVGAADATVEMALGALKAWPRHPWRLRTDLIAAEIALARGELEKPAALARRVVDECGTAWLKARALLVLGIVRHRQGAIDGAVDLLTSAGRALAVEPDEEILWRLHAALAEIDAPASAAAQRKAALASVYRIAGGLDDRPRARFLRSPGVAWLLDPSGRSPFGLIASPLQIGAGPAAPAAPSVLEAVRRISAEPAAGRLASTILEETLALCGARRGVFILVKKDAPLACVSRDVDHADPGALRALALRVIRLALRQGLPLASGDAPKDPRLAEIRAAGAELPRSLLCIPFRLRAGVHGAIYLDDPRRALAFGARELELAGIVAEHGAAAIRHATLQAAIDRDPGTGALSHAAFEQRLAEAVARPCALILLEIRNFKGIKDEFGRAPAAALLRTVVRTITELLGDVAVARRGGDEFELLLPGMTGADALRCAARLKDTLSGKALDLGGKAIRVALSAGVAAAPEHGRSAAELLQRADEALRRDRC